MTAQPVPPIPESLSPYAVPISGLVPYDKNPRRSDVQPIVESLKAHGQYRPIVVRRATNQVLAGNHTLAAAQSLGWEQIAATFVDVNEEQAARIVLVDNRTSDLGGYDVTALVELLDSLGEDAYIGTGYAEADIDQLLIDLQGAAEVTKNAAGYYEAVDAAGGARTSATDEWVGMPAYAVEDLTAKRQILVSFADDEAVADFCDRLDLTVTAKTRYLWFPPAEWDDTRALRYAATAETA